MPTDFELAGWDKIASVIYIIGSVIAIIAADKAQQILIRQQPNNETPPGIESDAAPLTVSQLVVIIGIIYVIGNVIYGQASFFRLGKKEKDIAAGTETGSDVPDKLIAFGWVFGIVGSLIRLAGAKLRLEEEKSGTV